MRVLDSFMISVDFCSDPVTLIMAVNENQVWGLITRKLGSLTNLFVEIVASLSTLTLLC